MSDKDAREDVYLEAREWCNSMRKDPDIGECVQLLQSLDQISLAKIVAYIWVAAGIYVGKLESQRTQAPSTEVKVAAEELLSAMDTCHICKCTVLVDGGPIHCLDCSEDCECHTEPDCEHISVLHQRLRKSLAGTQAPSEQHLRKVADDVLRQVVCDCGNYRHHGVSWMPEGSGEGLSRAVEILRALSAGTQAQAALA